MADDEFLGARTQCDVRSLFGGRVACFGRSEGQFLRESRLMEEGLYALYLLYHTEIIPSVGAVGVAFDRFLVAFFLEEEESTGRYPMFEWDSLYGDGSIIKDDLSLARVNRMEDKVKEHLILAEIVQHWAHDLLEIRLGVDVQWLGSAFLDHGYDQANKSQTVVGM